MQKSELKTNIEIEGVIITPEIIEELRYLQKNDNESLQLLRETLSDAVCFIGSIAYTFDDDEERKQALQAMADISMVRNNLQKFKKP